MTNVDAKTRRLGLSIKAREDRRRERGRGTVRLVRLGRIRWANILGAALNKNDD